MLQLDSLSINYDQHEHFRINFIKSLILTRSRCFLFSTHQWGSFLIWLLQSFTWGLNLLWLLRVKICLFPFPIWLFQLKELPILFAGYCLFSHRTDCVFIGLWSFFHVWNLLLDNIQATLELFLLAFKTFQFTSVFIGLLSQPFYFTCKSRYRICGYNLILLGFFPFPIKSLVFFFNIFQLTFELLILLFDSATMSEVLFNLLGLFVIGVL